MVGRAASSVLFSHTGHRPKHHLAALCCQSSPVSAYVWFAPARHVRSLKHPPFSHLSESHLPDLHLSDTLSAIGLIPIRYCSFTSRQRALSHRAYTNWQWLEMKGHWRTSKVLAWELKAASDTW